MIRRTFDAPRALVFRVYTDPELILQWWGPRRLATVTDTAVFQSIEDRDGMLQSGMEGGAVETMDRVAGLLSRT